MLADAVAHRDAGRRRCGTGRRRWRRRRRVDRPAADGIGAAIGRRRPCSVRRVHARLRAVAAELADIGRELRSPRRAIDEDPERLAAVASAGSCSRDLRRKYGDSLADVIASRARPRSGWPSWRATTRAWPSWSASARRGRRRARCGEARRRRRAGRRASLAAAVRDDCARWRCRTPGSTVTVGDEDPGDDVTFLLAANPGLPLLPLARVASGGELARTMLALRLVLSEAPDTLVFDEVDAGIGGAAATAVGRALAGLGGATRCSSSPTWPRWRRWPTRRSW